MSNKLKIIKVVFALAMLVQTIQAQETAKGIKDQVVKSHTHQHGCCQYKVIYFGGGFNNPSSSSNQKAYTVNTIALNLDYEQTILRKSGFSIGVNIGGHYSAGSGDPFASNVPQPYFIANQISSTVKESGNTKNSEYFIGVGPQFNIHFANRFVFSPTFQVGYMGISQSEFKATLTTVFDGPVGVISKNYTLISQTETQTNGLGFIPKVRLTYMITPKIGIWADASYLLGPTVKNSISTFMPQGEPNSKGVYSASQMDAGTYKTVVGKTRYNAVGFNLGIVFGFGGGTYRNIHQYPGGGHAVN
jgi:hypothetical protein